MTEWNWLDEPTKISEFDKDWVKDPKKPSPWGGNESGILVLVEEDKKQFVRLIGDETDLWSTQGCGCCSEGQSFKVLAWRLALEESAWEVPTRE